MQPLVETANATIEVFGDRWSLLVLRDIVFGDRRYFRELQAGSEEGIASNILTDRLKRLVELGLLTREDTRAGQRARYSLTEPAIQLVPVFAQLGSWGLHHRPTSRALRVRAELLEQGGPALWQEFMDEPQLLDLRALPPLDQAAAAAGLARHAVLHRRLAGVDEPVAPRLIDSAETRCRRAASATLVGQHREHQLQPRQVAWPEHTF